METVGTKFSAAMACKSVQLLVLGVSLLTTPPSPIALGCLGEVSIKEDEDYAKWAISIKVAFRDGENLAELTSHRQSGGVR